MEIELVCDSCGKNIHGMIYSNKFYILPCETCLERSHKTGIEEGEENANNAQ